MSRLRSLLTIAPLCLLLGCQSGPVGSMFASKDRTTFVTPAERSEQARAIALASSGADDAARQEALNELARRIQKESDPLVRETLIDAIAQFEFPLATQVLEAGLNDPDAGVRLQCCQAIGQRGTSSSVAALARAAAGDEEVDVRIAATRALGGVNSPEAVQALTVSLQDSNPALQFAGVEAMRSATGKDYGGDVAAYLAHARGETPMVASKPSRTGGGMLGRLSPF